MKTADPAQMEANKAKWMVYETFVNLVKNELIPAIENNPPQSLERLYPLKFLEALILQPASKSTIAGFSFGLTALTAQKEKAALSEVQKTSPSQILSSNAYIALNWKNEIYRKDFQDKWVQFVSKLSPSDADAFVKDLIEIKKMGFLNEWLNIRFPLSENPLKELADELAANREILGQLKNAVDLANHFEKTIDDWSNPDYAQKHRHEFVGKMVDTFQRVEGNYEKAGWLGKMAILGVSVQMVDVYDRTIKAVTGSTQFTSQEQKLAEFHGLLGGYRKFLEMAAGKDYAPGRRLYTKFASMNEFLIHLDKECVQAKKLWDPPPNPFEARSDFKVEPLTLGYQGDLDTVLLPLTDEEFFSVYHQNLIANNNIRKAKLGMDARILPQPVTELLAEISSGMYLIEKLSYISKEGGKLHLSFDIPLGMHSGKYRFIFDLKNPEFFELEFHLYGMNAHNRFMQIGSLAALITHSEKVEKGSLPLKYDQQGVSFSLRLPQKGTQAGVAFGYLQYFMEKLAIYSTSYQGILDVIPLEINNIKEEAFSESFHLNHEILKREALNNHWTSVATIAKQTLKGLGREGQKDYLDSVIIRNEEYEEHFTPALSPLIGNFDLIPGNNNSERLKSLRIESALYLVRCLKEGGEGALAARKAIDELSSNPQMLKVPELKDTVEGLKAAAAAIAI